MKEKNEELKKALAEETNLKPKKSAKLGDAIIVKTDTGEKKRGIILQSIAKVLEVYLTEFGVIVYPLDKDIYGNDIFLVTRMI